MSEASSVARHSPEVVARARRRYFQRFIIAGVLGAVVAGYTWGALAERASPEDWNDLLPQWLEAVLLGAIFALASLPVSGTILARALIPIPTFLLYLTVLLGKNPPLPYFAAFPLAILHAAALTVLSAYLAEHPERPRRRPRG